MLDNPPSTGNPPAVRRRASPSSRLDHVFDFQTQTVVFEVCIFQSSHGETMTTSFQKVEDTLFRVNRNGFILPGTPFEAMFALPQTKNSIEGSDLENPIYLPGIKVEHFRSFLRILYPLCV